MKLSNRLHSLNAIEAPPYLRAGILAAFKVEETNVVPIRATSRPLVPGFRWITLAAAAAAILFAVNIARSPRSVASPLVDQALVGLSESGSMTNSDPVALGQWLESRVGRHVEVPQITNASLMGARVATMNGVQAVAVTYWLRGKELTYFAMPGTDVMGAAVMSDRVRTTSSRGFNVATWTEHGAARAVVAQIDKRELAAVAKQCKRMGATTTY